MYPDLAALDDPFSEHEIMTAIKQLMYDKAPGPDGFMGCFFEECWNLIKHDFLAVINYFHMGRCANLNLLNKANIVLIPKKKRRQSPSPISGRSASSTPLRKLSARSLPSDLHRKCRNSSLPAKVFL
jgi:hypothetical protein